MSYSRRFTSDATEVLDNMHSLEIKLYKYEGRIEATYEITGSIGATDDDDDDQGGVAEQQDLSLIARLVARFQQSVERE